MLAKFTGILGTWLPKEKRPLTFEERMAEEQEKMTFELTGLSEGQHIDSMWTQMANRKNEVNLTKLPVAQQQRFLEGSDVAEWKSLVGDKQALRILTTEETEGVHRTQKHRIINSKWVRRWKEEEDTKGKLLEAFVQQDVEHF